MKALFAAHPSRSFCSVVNHDGLQMFHSSNTSIDGRTSIGPNESLKRRSRSRRGCYDDPDLCSHDEAMRRRLY